MSLLFFTALTLCGIGVLVAVILYFVANKFKVYEDPRIDEIEQMLPLANCGGCGFAGCRNFAEALVGNQNIDDFYCPVGGTGTMDSIAAILGKAAVAKEPLIAVVRCVGSCQNRPTYNIYDGVDSCAVMASLYGGETGCTFGCLMKGDCAVSCNFNALHLDPDSGLPVVDQEKCTACGACVKACPKNIIELRKRGHKDRRVFVSCVNHDKGGIARKACKVACIVCGKCAKICPFEAVTVQDNLAYIDYNKCKLCRKCVPECPTGAIWAVNFPVPQPKPEISEGEIIKPKEPERAQAGVS